MTALTFLGGWLLVSVAVATVFGVTMWLRDVLAARRRRVAPVVLFAKSADKEGDHARYN